MYSLLGGGTPKLGVPKLGGGEGGVSGGLGVTGGGGASTISPKLRANPPPQPPPGPPSPSIGLEASPPHLWGVEGPGGGKWGGGVSVRHQWDPIDPTETPM